jgi:hypothetical protein
MRHRLNKFFCAIMIGVTYMHFQKAEATITCSVLFSCLYFCVDHCLEQKRYISIATEQYHSESELKIWDMRQPVAVMKEAHIVN